MKDDTRGDRMVIEIQWPTGSVTAGNSPREVLSGLAALQWDTYTPEQMVHVLSDRAWNLQGEAIDPALPLYDFFARMQAAGICWIIRWETEKGRD